VKAETMVTTRNVVRVPAVAPSVEEFMRLAEEYQRKQEAPATPAPGSGNAHGMPPRRTH
jgi:hypothetical protein